MEKLLELLNAYDKDKWTIENGDLSFKWNSPSMSVSYLISKSYWFIDHLFREWKLDMNKIYNTDNLPRYDIGGWDTALYPFPDESILVLSTKNNPIEYLCSILKE